MAGTGEPPDIVDDSEHVLRRVPYRYFPGPVPTKPIHLTFMPRPIKKDDQGDVDGLSVDRMQYTTVEAAAAGRSGKTFHVAKVYVGAVRRMTTTKVDPPHHLLNVVAAKIPENLAHSLIPQINSRVLASNRPAISEWVEQLVNACVMERIADAATDGKV